MQLILPEVNDSCLELLSELHRLQVPLHTATRHSHIVTSHQRDTHHTAPHRATPHRTAPHHTAPHRTAPHHITSHNQAACYTTCTGPSHTLSRTALH
jgi:hypothetical protein